MLVGGHNETESAEKKHLIDDELQKLAPKNPNLVTRYSLDHLAQYAPNYLEMLEHATQMVNAVSKHDPTYAKPPAIFLTSTPSVKIESIRDIVTGRRAILLSTPYAQSLDFSALVVQHQHEVAHQYHGIPSSIIQTHLYELEADWHAEALPLINDLLARSISNRPAYDADASKSDHPNLKARMVMALLKEFGYGAMWTELSEHTPMALDQKIAQPLALKVRHEDGYALNEDGMRISNWESLKSAIHDQVKESLTAIDALVEQQASPSQQAAFMQNLQANIAQFKKEHPQHVFYFFNELQIESFKSDAQSAAQARTVCASALRAAHVLLSHIEREVENLQPVQTIKVMQHARQQLYLKLIQGDFDLATASAELSQ